MDQIIIESSLSTKQMQVLSEIVCYMQEHGYAPTFQEIADACGIKSKSVARVHVLALIKKGVLETDHPGCPRAIRLKKPR